jgi:hypothetical protein
MTKLLMSFLGAAVILTIFCSLMDGGGGIVATRLTQNVAIADNHLDVASTTGFLASGILWLQAEKLAYTGVNSTAFTGLTRGYEDTTAKGHSTTSSNGQSVKVYSETAGLVNKALGYDVGTLATTGGWTAVPLILKDFFVYTLPKLITWNYSFFEGDLLILVRYVLMGISIALLIAFALQLGNMIANIFK